MSGRVRSVMVLIHNLKCKDVPRELLTEEEIDLLTTPAELTEFKDAIVEAMSKGTKRNIESEGEGKNAQAG